MDAFILPLETDSLQSVHFPFLCVCVRVHVSFQTDNFRENCLGTRRGKPVGDVTKVSMYSIALVYLIFLNFPVARTRKIIVETKFSSRPSELIICHTWAFMRMCSIPDVYVTM